jgi:hypothetical protein
MLLDAIDVQTRDLVDGLVEVDDAGCAIDVFELNRQRAALIRLEGIPERLFDLGYESVPGFVTMFRKALGISPGRYMAERHSSRSRGYRNLRARSA